MQFSFVHCAHADNINTRPVEGQWKFLGGGGYQKPKFLKESMGLNWSFQRGGGIQTKKNPPWEGNLQVYFFP